MSGPYSVLMVDPPWPVSGVFGPDHGRLSKHKMPYTTAPLISVWDMLDRDVFSQAEPHHALFLWTLDQYLSETETELIARGYRRSARLVWDKVSGPYVGILRRTHEYLLWYCRPRLLPIEPSMRGHYPTVLRSTVRQHSRKPSAAYAMVEALYPNARRLDAFTREYRPGWDGMGDQRDHFTPLLAPLRDEALS